MRRNGWMWKWPKSNCKTDRSATGALRQDLFQGLRAFHFRHLRDMLDGSVEAEPVAICTLKHSLESRHQFVIRPLGAQSGIVGAGNPCVISGIAAPTGFKPCIVSSEILHCAVFQCSQRLLIGVWRLILFVDLRQPKPRGERE